MIMNLLDLTMSCRECSKIF